MKRLLLATGALFAASSAFAVGPMATQSADVLARSDCEVEGQWARDDVKLEGIRLHATTLGTRVECGAFDATQLSLVGSRTKLQGSKADSLRLVGKTRLWDGGNNGGRLALTYGVHGERERKFDFDYTRTELGLAYTQAFAQQHKVHANLGVYLDKGGHSSTGWALGYEFAATPTMSLLAETYGGKDWKPTQAVGLRWTPAKEWSVGAMLSRPRLEDSVRGSVTQLNTTVAYRF